jgi:UDP-arabinose 4-epimerase
MTILVVGGAGYIGSHTCKALKQKGYLPVVYDSLQNSTAESVKFGPLVVGNLLDEKQLDEALKLYQPKAVLHFASSIDCRASKNDPGGYYRNNVVGSLNLLQALERHKIRHLVFSSTAAVYGLPETARLKESHPCVPINVYGNTKWMVEKMIHDFAQSFSTVILRYFNAAGADPDGELGEAHNPETHLIPLAIRVALEKQQHLHVFGDGLAIRDYIHVTDLADAHVKALEWLLLSSIQSPMTLNLGTGQGYTLLDVLKMVEHVSQKSVKKIMQPKHSGEPPSLVADPTLAHSLLGWKPVLSDLATIVSTAYRWHEKQETR